MLTLLITSIVTMLSYNKNSIYLQFTSAYIVFRCPMTRPTLMRKSQSGTDTPIDLYIVISG